MLSRIFWTPGERRLRSGWRLAGHLFILVVFFSIFGGCLGVIVFASGWVIDYTSLLMALVLAFMAITASVYVARRWLDRRTFSSLGLHTGRHAAGDLLYGIALAGGMIALIFLVEWAAGWLIFEGFAWQTDSPLELLSGTAAAFLAFVLVGWQEELVSRGYWLQNLAEGLNRFWGVVISSAFFALAHLSNPHASWAAIVGILMAGLLFAFAYLRTGQLWLAIGLHTGWNFFEATVFGYPVSGISGLYRLVRQSVQGPEWITGGAFGPEAGLILLPVVLLGAWAIYLFTRNRNPVHL